MKKTILSLLVVVGMIAGASAQIYSTDTFGAGANQFSLDFTTIGNPGNAADSTGYGKVDYTYRIGTHAISQNQIAAATASGLQNVTAGAWSGNQPAANISWYQCAAFVNWLNTSTGHHVAYNLTYNNGSYSMGLWHSLDEGYNPSNPLRNNLALYVLPSTDEWYKAAYGMNNGMGYYLFPTASDTQPTIVASGTNAGTAVYNLYSSVQGPASVYEAGGLSSYGTMGQGGNLYQYMEGAAYGLSNIDLSVARDVRGGSWYSAEYLSPGNAVAMSSSYSFYNYSDNPVDYIGFRVAAVPEPSTCALFALGAITMLMVMRRKQRLGQAF